MSEWWTYELSDFLLFAPRTYYRLIELYNAEIWPGQFVALLAGLAVLALLRGRAAWQGRGALALLAAGWLWVAWAFHYTRYATINWAAVYFALAFAVQGAAMLALAVARAGRPPGPPGGLAGAMGMALALRSYRARAGEPQDLAALEVYKALALAGSHCLDQPCQTPVTN